MRLLELFNRTADWRWLPVQLNPFPGMFQHAAGFEVEGIEYAVGIGQIPLLPGLDTHMMGFAAKVDGEWEEDELGSGNEILVFSTVMDIIGDYLKKKSPQVLVLGAKPHREKIYNRLLRRKADELDDAGYVQYGRMEDDFPMYGRVVLLPLVRKDKLDMVQEMGLE